MRKAGERKWWVRALIAAAYAVALLSILHFGWGRRALWRTQLVDKGIGGDGIQYWSMAVHLEREHMVSLDGKQPTWMRLPGYPALLRLFTRAAESDDGAGDPKSIQARIDAWIRRAVRLNLTVDLGCAVAAFLLALALGAGPLALGAALLWVIQPWSSVVALHTLSDPLATLLTTLCLAALALAVRWRLPSVLALAGALAGLAQYVRPDSILLLPALLVGGYLAQGARPRALVGVLLWAVVFAPWPLRNHHLFGAFHPLGAAGLDAKGKAIDRAAPFAWMRTWCVGREPETVGVAWKLPGAPLYFEDLPPTAYDNSDEMVMLRTFLRDYNTRGSKLDSDLRQRLEVLAAARRSRHRLDYLVRLPWQRIKLRLQPPRDGYGLGTLPTLRVWRDDWVWFDELVVLAALGGLALLLARPACRAMAVVMALWLAARCSLIGWLPAPEPRYFLEALPLIVALAITLPASGAAALAAAMAALGPDRRRGRR